MINVELDIKLFNRLIITLDAEGVDELVRGCGYVTEKLNHHHFFSQSWTSPEGAELTEYLLSGRDFHWCHELTVASVDENYFTGNAVTHSMYVDITHSGEIYEALQVTIVRTQREWRDIINALKNLSKNNDEMCLQLDACISRKASEIARCSLFFKYIIG